MADTVSNHKLLIVNDGSTHLAYSEEDICRPKKKKSCTPFVYVNLSKDKVAPGSKNSTITRIHGHLIHLVGGTLGKEGDQVAELAIHDQKPIGCSSHKIYRQFSFCYQGSPDALVEGKQVARTTDKVTCNAHNCVGVIHGADQDPATLTEGEFRDEKCTVTKLTGKDSNGRPLEWSGEKEEGEPNYIEILAGDTVEYTAEWECVTDPSRGKDPSCTMSPSEHPQWKAEATERGAPHKQHDEKLNQKTYTLSSPLNEVNFYRARVTGPNDSQGEVRALMQFATIFGLWNYRKQPKMVNVFVNGCGGGKRAIVAVFPNKGIEASHGFGTEGGFLGPGQSARRQLPGALGTLQRVLGFVLLMEKAVHEFEAAVSQPGQRTRAFDFKVLEGFSVVCAAQYKHVTEKKRTAQNNFIRPAYCRLSLDTVLEGTVFEVAGRLNVPLLTVIGGVFGKLAQWLAEKVGISVRADLFVEANFKVTVDGGLEIDQNDVFTPKGGFKFITELSIGLELQIDSYKVTGKVTFTGICQAYFVKPIKEGAVLSFDLQLVFEFSFSVVVSKNGSEKANWSEKLISEPFYETPKRFDWLINSFKS